MKRSRISILFDGGRPIGRVLQAGAEDNLSGWPSHDPQLRFESIDLDVALLADVSLCLLCGSAEKHEDKKSNATAKQAG